MRWKKDEGWSYEWWNDWKTTGHQIIIDEKAGVFETRNQNTLKSIKFAVTKRCARCLIEAPQNNRFCQTYFVNFQAN